MGLGVNLWIVAGTYSPSETPEKSINSVPDECCSERWTLTTYTQYCLHHTIVYSNLQFLFSCLESQSFYKDVFEYVQKNMSLEELLSLLTEDEPWENLVTEAKLSR